MGTRCICEGRCICPPLQPSDYNHCSRANSPRVRGSTRLGGLTRTATTVTTTDVRSCSPPKTFIGSLQVIKLVQKPMPAHARGLECKKPVSRTALLLLQPSLCAVQLGHHALRLQRAPTSLHAATWCESDCVRSVADSAVHRRIWICQHLIPLAQPETLRFPNHPRLQMASLWPGSISQMVSANIALLL